MKKAFCGITRKLKQNKRGMTVAELMVATIIILLVSAGMVTAIRQATVNFSKSMAQSEAKKLCSSLETLVENELRYTNVIDYAPTPKDGLLAYRSKNYQSTDGDCEDLQVFSAVTTTGGDTSDGYGIVTVRSKKRGSADTRNVKILPDGMYPHGLKANVKIDSYNEGLFTVTVSVRGDGGTSLTDTFTVKNLYYGSGVSAVADPTALHTLVFLASDRVEVLARLDVLTGEAPDISKVPSPKWSPVDGKAESDYRLDGWEGGGHLYDVNLDEVTTGTHFTMPNGDVFLTSKYSFIYPAATVSFDLNEGSMPAGVEPPASVSVPTPPASITLPCSESGEKPIKDGYEFIGWKAEGSSEVLSPGTSATITVDVTYYAQWQEKEYILLLKNGNEIGNSASWKIDKNGNVVHGDTPDFVNLFHDGDQSTGNRAWELEGWYDISSKTKVLNANGTRALSAADLLTLAEAQEDRTLTLYAGWTNNIAVYTETNEIKAGSTYMITNSNERGNYKAMARDGTIVSETNVYVGSAKIYKSNSIISSTFLTREKKPNDYSGTQADFWENSEWTAETVYNPLLQPGIVIKNANNNRYLRTSNNNGQLSFNGSSTSASWCWIDNDGYFWAGYTEFSISLIPLSILDKEDWYIVYDHDQFVGKKAPIPNEAKPAHLYVKNPANTLFSFNGAD